MSDVQSLLVLQKLSFLHTSVMSAPQRCFQRYWRWVDTFHWCPLSDHEWTKMRQLSTWKRLKVSSSYFILTAEPLKINFSWTCKFIFAQYKDCGCVPLSLTLKFHWKEISSRPFKGTHGHVCTIFYVSILSSWKNLNPAFNIHASGVYFKLKCMSQQPFEAQNFKKINK